MASLRSPRIQTSPSLAYIDSVGDVSAGSATNGQYLIYDNATSTWIATSHAAGPASSAAFSATHEASQSFVPGVWNPVLMGFLANNSSVAIASIYPNIESLASTTLDSSQNGANLATATYLDVADASGFEDPAGSANAIALLSVTIGGRKWAVAYNGISIGGGSGGVDRINISTSSALGAGYRGQGTLTTGDAIAQEECRGYNPDSTPSTGVFDKVTIPLEPLTTGNVKTVRRRSVDFLYNFTNDAQASPTTDVVSTETATWFGTGGIQASSTTPDTFSVVEIYLPDVGATAGTVDAGSLAYTLAPFGISDMKYLAAAWSNP